MAALDFADLYELRRRVGNAMKPTVASADPLEVALGAQLAATWRLLTLVLDRMPLPDAPVTRAKTEMPREMEHV